MNNVLLITSDYPPKIGGVSNYYANLVKHLKSVNIEVITNNHHQLAYSWPFFGWIKCFFTILKITKTKKISTILVGQILPFGTAIWLIGKLKKIPYIVFTHAMDITIPQKYPRKKFLLKLILKSANKIITVSRYTKYEILKIMQNQDQRKIEIISPAPNITPQLFPHLQITDLKKSYQQKKIILSVGRLVERKGYDYVVEVLPLLIKQKIDFQYIIIGSGEYQNQLQTLVQKLNLSEYVIFKDNLADEEVAKFYQICDVFIMPSRELENHDVEGFGLVFLEANSFGKPVIGGKSGGIADAILDGKNGYLVEPENHDMIAKALIQLLTKPDLAIKIGSFGKERVEKEFTWQAKAKQLDDILSCY